MQTLTVHLPDPLYHSLKDLASSKNQSVEDEVVERVASTVPANEPSTLWGKAWSVLNQRRCALIHKKNRDGLSAEELVEYERLQVISLEALETWFPGPLIDESRLDRIEARLKDAEPGSS